MARREAASAAILDGDGRLLLVRENYDRKRYTLPGGALESGETVLEAAVRETVEETGVTVRLDHVVGMYRIVDGLTVTLFRAAIRDGEPTLPASGEIAEVGWFAPDEIPHPRSNILHHALEDVVTGRRGVIRDGLPRLN